MTIRAWHIMREKSSVKPDTTAQDIAHKIISSGLPGLPVVNDAMEVVGMVTEHHILAALGEGLDLEKLPAQELMMTTPITADMNTSPEELIRMMLINNCCAVLPIVNNRKYVGVVSRHMLMEIKMSPYYTRFAQKDRKGPFVCL